MESVTYSNEINDLKLKNDNLRVRNRKLEQCLKKAIEEVKSRDQVLHQNNILIGKLSKAVTEYKPYPTVPLRNNLMNLVKSYRSLMSNSDYQSQSNLYTNGQQGSNNFNGSFNSSIELDSVIDLGDDLQDDVYLKLENDDLAGLTGFHCKTCGETLATRTLYQQHQRKHARNSRFKCELCDYRAAQYNRIVRHMRRHTGERPYPCDRCSYRATQSSSLARHMRMHTGERPYRCDRCDYSTTQSNTLNKHRLIHQKQEEGGGVNSTATSSSSSSALHKCDRCDFKTVMLEKLEEHMAAHEREQQVVMSHASAAALAALPLDVAPPMVSSAAAASAVSDIHQMSLPITNNLLAGVVPQTTAEQVLLGAQMQNTVDHLRLASGMLP